MSKRVEIRGASGATYSFYVLDESAALKSIGVTYVIADRADSWRVRATGELSNLASGDWAIFLDAARKAHPAAELLIRMNVSRSIREAEGADIAAGAGLSG